VPALVDTHVHLLAGLDDGPKTMEESLEMARILCAEGAGHTVALAHQSDDYPLVTPALIRSATAKFAAALAEAGISLNVHATAEVMASPDLVTAWKAGQLVSVADHGQWLLVEFPHNLYIDLRPIINDLRPLGVRVILAHAERTPELLHQPGIIENLIEAGCIVQVNSGSLTKPASAIDEKALTAWFKRGIVHLLGSDGHSPRRRAPRLAKAAERIRHLVGASHADSICSTNGLAILRGTAPPIAPPRPPGKSWFTRLFSR